MQKGKLELKKKASEQSKAPEITEEESNLLKQSKSALENKAKLYDKLSKGSKNDEEKEINRKYLVEFDKKINKGRDDDSDDERNRYSESEDDVNEDSYRADNSDDEWVEYVDCLGRTRTCLRKDLSVIKEKDKSLRSTVEKRESREEIRNNYEKESDEKSEDEDEIPSEDFKDDSEMLSSDMQRELQRRKWEKEEDDLQHKSDVHYQDVLFNEARTHGVGYYGFSKDEEERARQQESLNNLRKETQQKQKTAQEVKKNREKQMKTRILAATNRKRVREGLPPLTELEEENPTKVEPIEPEKPKLSHKDEENEKKREDKRKKHVRPWDIGKDGVKEHVEYSQEEWVDKQRKNRDEEFAPPSCYTHDKYSAKIEPKKKLNPYLSNSKQESRPIQNELSEDSSEDEDRLMSDFYRVQKGAAIPPPSTFDYYGPSSKKQAKFDKNDSDMEDSIMQGLKYIRNKVEKKKY